MTTRRIPEDFLSKILSEEELKRIPKGEEGIAAVITYKSNGNGETSYYAVIPPHLHKNRSGRLSDELMEDEYNLDEA